ncbi:MAG: HepT-like ribonuclease domain-containing protein [Thermodesulfobacteriota bacterium]|nr:HepT-like ribonuclease domain-containing protein [Thermodesulfobacteriota bacterium]
MYDKELVLEILRQIYQAAQTILIRFGPVKTVGDFTDTSVGMEKLDSICMLLIAIGEALKNLDKVTHHTLLPLYPQVDWKKAKGMRDIISHHYFETDADVIYDVCKNHIPELAKTISKMIRKFS